MTDLEMFEASILDTFRLDGVGFDTKTNEAGTEIIYNLADDHQFYYDIKTTFDTNGKFVLQQVL